MNTKSPTAAHTPGPWKWIGSKGNPTAAIYLRGPDFKTVGVAINGFGASNVDENLIAAAPQLLAALEAIVAFNTPLPCGLLEQARAAIQAAKGEA